MKCTGRGGDLHPVNRSIRAENFPTIGLASNVGIAIWQAPHTHTHPLVTLASMRDANSIIRVQFPRPRRLAHVRQVRKKSAAQMLLEFICPHAVDREILQVHPLHSPSNPKGATA